MGQPGRGDPGGPDSPEAWRPAGVHPVRLPRRAERPPAPEGGRTVARCPCPGDAAVPAAGPRAPELYSFNLWRAHAPTDRDAGDLQAARDLRPEGLSGLAPP